MPDDPIAPQPAGPPTLDEPDAPLWPHRLAPDELARAVEDWRPALDQLGDQ